jgi:N-acetyl sugar amidotransferase
VPDITFDDNGMCSYCKLYDQMAAKWPGGVEGHAQLLRITRQIRAENRDRRYDCIVGVSGGSDSSYMLYRLKEIYELRPLAVHFDNGWNSKVATENLKQITERLNIDLEIVKVDPEEFKSMQRAFLESGSVDIETPSDIGLAAALYRVAHKYGLKYIFEGHNFRTEGSWPLGWLYMDQRYIDSICKKHGRWPLQTFPTMHMHDMFHWMVWHGIKKIRPWYYWDTDKATVIKFLEKEYGWTWYGGHHLENRATAVYHSWFMPGRFGLDTRVNGFSALIRSGQLSREGAVAMMAKPPYMRPLLENDYVHELGYSKAEFGRVLLLPRKTFRDFKTYKKWFEFLRPVFWLLAELNRVPYTFTEKYCRKNAGRWDPEAEAEARERVVMCDPEASDGVL